MMFIVVFYSVRLTRGYFFQKIILAWLTFMSDSLSFQPFIPEFNDKICLLWAKHHTRNLRGRLELKCNKSLPLGSLSSGPALDPCI